MKNIFFSTILLISSYSPKAQTLSDTSVVYPQIKQFYYAGIKDTNSFGMPLVYHHNILDSGQSEFGIFVFRPLTSIDLQKLYFRNFGSNSIEIIRDYALERLLPRVLEYFKTNKSSISYFQKLDCITKIMEILRTRAQ